MIDTIGATHSGHVMCGSEDSFAAELLNGLPCLILSICRTNACKLPPHQLRSAQRLLGLRWNFSRVLDGHGKKVQRLGSKHAVATSSFASSLAVIACDRPLRRRSLAPRSALELQLGFLGLTGGGLLGLNGNKILQTGFGSPGYHPRCRECCSGLWRKVSISSCSRGASRCLDVCNACLALPVTTSRVLKLRL